MSLSATMDAAHKTGKYADYIPKLKSNIQSINNLFDTLLSITKREHHAIRKSPIDIVPIIQTIRDELQTMYANKKIISTLHIPKEKIISSHVDICRIIFHNIMQNAYKYTPN
jgi:signal transduction histidine kinase